MRGKAELPLSVRLTGRIGGGHVEFGQGVVLIGNIVPIEFVSTKMLAIDRRSHVHQLRLIDISSQKDQNWTLLLLGHHTLILDNNEHGVEDRDTPPPSAPVTIEDHAWIGSRVIILPGCSVGHHSVVGAGSVVTKDIPANCLAVGNSARVVRQFASFRVTRLV